jgi:hypothetical protein
MKSEKEKMLSGELYSPLDPQLFTEPQGVRLLFKASSVMEIFLVQPIDDNSSC